MSVTGRPSSTSVAVTRGAFGTTPTTHAAGITFDVATNSTRNYSVFDGNYWDAYRGYDLDRDGTGDAEFHPVRLFSLLVERNEPSVIFLRSFLVQLLDAAESVIPSLTPETLVDASPRMAPVRGTADGNLARRGDS